MNNIGVLNLKSMRPRAPWLAVLLLGLLAGGWLYFSGSLQMGGSQVNRAAHTKLPAFRLQDPDGNWVEEKALRGKVTLFHFWATWCAPCLGELPEFLELATSSASEANGMSNGKLVLVPVSLDKSWKDAAKIFPRDYKKGSIQPLIDPKAEVAERLGSYQYPETYLVDSAGLIRAKWVGPQDWKSPIVLAMIKKVLGEGMPADAPSN